MTVPLADTETARANEALRHIGEPRIASLDATGRKAARECRAAFASVRDQLLRDANWQFAKASAAPAAIGAPADGLYLYRYAMPVDCVAIREIVGAHESEWEVRHAGDDGDPRVMVDCNIAAAQFVYTRRVVNPAIGRDKSKTAELKAEADDKLPRARAKETRESSGQFVSKDTSWIAARRGGARPR